MFAPGMPFDAHRQLATVHLGHVEIRENQIGNPMIESVQYRSTRLKDRNTVASEPEELAGGLSEIRLVVYDDHVESFHIKLHRDHQEVPASPEIKSAAASALSDLPRFQFPTQDEAHSQACESEFFRISVRAFTKIRHESIHRGKLMTRPALTLWVLVLTACSRRLVCHKSRFLL